MIEIIVLGGKMYVREKANNIICQDGCLYAYDYEPDPDPANWRTISGAKVHLDENGEIDGGAGGKFTGNYFDGNKGGTHVIGPHTMMRKNIQSGATGIMVGSMGGANTPQGTQTARAAQPKETGAAISQKEAVAYMADNVENIGFVKQFESIQYNPVKRYDKQPSEDEIVDKIAGADKTKGSCASLALCYVGQKNGMDVVDFRGGESQAFVSRGRNYEIIIGKENLVASDKSTNTISSGVKMLKEMDKYPAGKEFILVTGKHTSVVRRTEDGRHQYLELQSGNRNGWRNFRDTNGQFTMTTQETLRYRFGCQKSHTFMGQRIERQSYLVDCDKLKQSKRFECVLGSINTDPSQQQKGEGGGIK